jgi:DNA invertase Pin-like site-specific DNA recombinase
MKNKDTGTIYGYCRCSTNETKQDIHRQVRELKKLGATDTTIYKEYVSGSSDNKIELNKLLNVINEGDTLCVTEISRLTRSMKQLCSLIETIQNKKLRLIVKDSITIDCRNATIDPMTKAFLQMSGVFNELEKDMIRARVKSGVANAKAKGKQIGRRPLTINDIPQKVKDKYNLWLDGSITKVDYAKMCDISRPTLDRYLKLIEDNS